MSDNAKNLKMQPGDADPVVTIFTQNEYIFLLLSMKEETKLFS